MTKDICIIGFLLCFSISACHSTKGQAKRTSDQEDSTEKIGEGIAAENSQNSYVKQETNEKDAKISVQPEDSLFASIERTICYGTCPVYKISVYKSGYTTYHGKRFVDKTGWYKTTTSKEEKEKIKEKAAEIGYFELEDKYDNPGVTDIPSTITYLNFNGKEKKITNRYGGPEKLKEFEKFFDAIYKDKEWIEIEGKQ